MLLAINPVEQAYKLKNKKIRVIHSEDFSDENHNMILSEMPDKEDYDKQASEIITKKNKTNIDVNMLPCYQMPLLSKEQEIHLFRKMNFIKFLAVKKIEQIDLENVNDDLIEDSIELLKQYEEIRNDIANANFRLLGLLLKNKYYESSINDQIISDAYFHILQAIEYFDYTLGNKFSTYATWVIKRNLGHTLKKQSKQDERFVTGGDSFDHLASVDIGYQKEIESNEAQTKIQSVISSLKEKKEFKRQMYALEHWFGLNGCDKKTLEQISKKLGVTKERVRQLKERGLEAMRQSIDKENF